MDESNAVFVGLGLSFFFFVFFIWLFYIIAYWKVFEKAGQPGWATLIPIYSAIVFLRIIGKPWWWILLFCIPVVNIVFLIWAINLLSKSFGQSEGFTIGLIVLGIVFVPLLGFGRYQYIGPVGNPEAFRAYQDSQYGLDKNFGG